LGGKRGKKVRKAYIKKRLRVVKRKEKNARS